MTRADLNSLFFPRKDLAPKAQRRNQAKAQNATSKQQGYGGPTTPIIVLP